MEPVVQTEFRRIPKSNYLETSLGAQRSRKGLDQETLGVWPTRGGTRGDVLEKSFVPDYIVKLSLFITDFFMIDLKNKIPIISNNYL